jgi:hypothetical protein
MYSNCRSPKNTQSYAQQLRLVCRQPGHNPRTSNLDYKAVMPEKRGFSLTSVVYQRVIRQLTENPTFQALRIKQCSRVKYNR